MQYVRILILVILFSFCIIISDSKLETWKSKLSSMTIGVTHEGFSRAVVDCGDNEVAFIITMDDEFHGSIYTRGSYHLKNTPCFRDADGGKDFALKFSFGDCGMKYESSTDTHTTTVVVQHDDDLIFPGDLAFAIHCRRDVRDNKDGGEIPVRSRITLVDADPGAEKPDKDVPEHSASSTSDVATLLPPPEHEEL